MVFTGNWNLFQNIRTIFYNGSHLYISLLYSKNINTEKKIAEHTYFEYTVYDRQI